MCLNSQNLVIYAECREINFNLQFPHGAEASLCDLIKIQSTTLRENLHATILQEGAGSQRLK